MFGGPSGTTGSKGCYQEASDRGSLERKLMQDLTVLVPEGRSSICS
jgi:hypothetical protein